MHDAWWTRFDPLGSVIRSAVVNRVRIFPASAFVHGRRYSAELVIRRRLGNHQMSIISHRELTSYQAM